jgi:protein-tyrosine phosphatase
MSGGVTDLHSHVIPGVDDGARDLSEARQALATLAAEGVRVVAATPHIDGSLTADPARLARRLAQIDAGWSELRRDGELPLTMVRGAEVKLDIPEVDLSDPRLRLGGGHAVLVEFPYMSTPPRSGPVLAAIRQAGYVPVLAHPERYTGVDEQLAVVRSWLDAGAVLQVNTASILGRYGPAPRALALRLLARGWAACLASDFHSRGHPSIIETRTRLEEWGCGEQARVLLEVNPDRLLRNEPCIPVDPIVPTRNLTRAIRRILPW